MNSVEFNSLKLRVSRGHLGAAGIAQSLQFLQDVSCVVSSNCPTHVSNIFKKILEDFRKMSQFQNLESDSAIYRYIYKYIRSSWGIVPVLCTHPCLTRQEKGEESAWPPSFRRTAWFIRHESLLKPWDSPRSRRGKELWTRTCSTWVFSLVNGCSLETVLCSSLQFSWVEEKSSVGRFKQFKPVKFCNSTWTLGASRNSSLFNFSDFRKFGQESSRRRRRSRRRVDALGP